MRLSFWATGHHWRQLLCYISKVISRSTTLGLNEFCLFGCLFVFKGKKGKRKTTLVRAFMYFKWNVSFLIFLHYSETTQNEFVGIGYFLICNTYWIDIWHAFIVINFICEICRFHFPWLFLVFNLVPWALGHYESFSFKVKVCVNCHLKTKLTWYFKANKYNPYIIVMTE